MSRGYFTTPISDNLEETPEGFLIARDCVIARTGWQTYKVGDLPQQAADEMGVDTSNPQANIDLYRDDDEVFHPDTLASFEGKAVTDNHPPDGQFVEPANYNQFARGHVQNVRRGDEPLDSGEWPVIADLLIMAEPLLSRVKNKLVRELSCGYDFGIRKKGNKIFQCDITGNHVAVVPKGRAGPEARINDSAPEATSTSTEFQPVVQERLPVPKVNMIRHLIGRGLKALAADGASPEELADAAAAIQEHQEPPAESSTATDKAAADAKAADRKRMHDSLDCIMDGRMKDADIEGMRKIMADLFPPKEEPVEDVDTTELEETLGADTEVVEEPAEKNEEDDEEEELELEEEEEGVRAEDRMRAADGVMAALKIFKPLIVRNGDASLVAAFNKTLAATKSSRASTGTYGAFAGAGRARDGAPLKPANIRASERHAGAGRGRAADTANPEKNLQDYYNKAHRGGTK